MNRLDREKIIKEYWGYDDLSKFSDQKVFGIYQETLRYKNKKGYIPVRKREPKVMVAINKFKKHEELCEEIVNWINTSSFDINNGENPKPMATFTYLTTRGFSYFTFIDKDYNSIPTIFKLYISGKKIYTTYNSNHMKRIANKFDLEIEKKLWDGKV